MTRSMSAPRVAVFGAGAFGGWTALELVRRGAQVTLIDAWGPGNVRASSGGGTRIIRATYGSHAVYTAMAVSALERWRAYEDAHHAGLLRQTGALWLFGEDRGFADASAATLRDHGITFSELDLVGARRRYPQVDFDGVSRVCLEPDAGYVFASRACEHVASQVVAGGGVYCQAAATRPAAFDGCSARLEDGTSIEADAFVFACGPWLGGLFPDVVGRHVVPTRQEVYYFRTPPGDARFLAPSLPIWLEASNGFIYGIPGDGVRGFKIADDTPGPVMDPTSDDRLPTASGIEGARAYLARRFPALRDAPLLETEVCQYEAAPDSHFIIDRHPHDARIWIAGGGSGHGFKMGPIVGEMVAALVLGTAVPDPRFGLGRFARPPAGGWQAKWS